MRDNVHIKIFGYYNTFFQGYIDQYVMDIISDYAYKENKYVGDILSDVDELGMTNCGIDSVYDILPTYNDMNGMDTTSLLIISCNKKTLTHGHFIKEVKSFIKEDLTPIVIKDGHYNITFHDYGRGECLYNFKTDNFDINKLSFKVNTLELHSDYHTIITDVMYGNRKLTCIENNVNYRGPTVEFE